MSIKEEINQIYLKHKRELTDFVESKLREQFKEYFVKFPKVKSVKVSSGQVYNDNDYDSVIQTDSEYIKINGYSFYDLDGEWGDENSDAVKEVGLTEDEHYDAAQAARAIFREYQDHILIHLYGSFFGLKITTENIILESSDFDSY